MRSSDASYRGVVAGDAMGSIRRLTSFAALSAILILACDRAVVDPARRNQFQIFIVAAGRAGFIHHGQAEIIFQFTGQF